MTLNIVTDPGRIDLPVPSSTAASCLIASLWNPPWSVTIHIIMMIIQEKRAMFILCMYVCVFILFICNCTCGHDCICISASAASLSACVCLCFSASVLMYAVITVCVSLAMLFYQRREERPVTIVMRGIYISYLAVNHFDLFPSCLIPKRQVCFCLCVWVHACICVFVSVWLCWLEFVSMNKSCVYACAHNWLVLK